MQTFLEIGDEHEAAQQTLSLVLDYTTTSDTLDQTPPADPEESNRTWTMEPTPRRNRPWTYDEEQLLTAGRRLNMTYEQIGAQLGRSYRSCMTHYSTMRLEGRL